MPKKTERGATMATSHLNNNTSKLMSQEEIVLEHIRRYGSITSMDAFKRYSITRLSGRIFNLRRRGYDIELLWEVSQYGTRFGRYILHEEEIA